MRARLSFFTFTLVSASVVVSATAEAPRPLVERWLREAAKVKTLTVDFVQERQLKTLKRPLQRSGKLWFSRDGKMRWQIDEPPVLILLQTHREGPAHWIDTKKKTVKPVADDAGRSDPNQALQMLTQTRAASIEEFEQAFHLRDSEPIRDAEGRWRIRLGLQDRRAALSVKDVFFEIEPATGALHLMEFQLRDGSILRTRITKAVRDAALDPSLFHFDFEGYTSLRP